MAYFLDGFVITPVYYVMLGLVGIDLATFGIERFPDRATYVLVSLGLLVVNAAYFIWFWSGGRRATPGQRLFSIQVANAFDGKPLTIGQAFGRWAALGQWVGVLFFVPFIATAIISTIVAAIWNVALLLSTITSPTKQGLQDRFANSALVRPAGAGNRWAVGCLTLLVVGILLEGALVLWVSMLGPRYALPPDYWDRFFRWMWPA